MIRKGINFHRAKHLDWRYAVDTDRTMRGESIPTEYAVIFSRKTGKLIPILFHSRTNMAYGKSRWRGRLETYPVYWVEDRAVYQGTVRKRHEAAQDMEAAQWTSDGTSN